MSEFLSNNLPYLLSGISVGGQYALIAIGYTMVYGILRLINFAHGDVFMVAGLIMVYATASLPIYVSIILVIVVTVILGVIIEKVAYKPLRSAPRDVGYDFRHRCVLSAAELCPVLYRRSAPDLSLHSLPV